MTSQVSVSDSNKHPVSTFRDNIDSLLLRFNEELQQSKNIKNQAEAFTQRGFFSRWTGSFTTRNDTDLAEMITSLGGSLSITQDVVHCLLQIQSEKNQVLKRFHTALVDKLDDLASNDSILDLNVRENFTLILEHLKDQVEDKLEQSDRVDQHALQLEDHADRLFHIESDLEAQQKNHMYLAEQFSSLEELSGTLMLKSQNVETDLAASQKLISGIERKMASLEQRLGMYSQQHAVLQQALNEHCVIVMQSLQDLEENHRLLARAMRKNGINYRDLLLFATTAAVAVLFWLHFRAAIG